LNPERPADPGSPKGRFAPSKLAHLRRWGERPPRQENERPDQRDREKENEAREGSQSDCVPLNAS
jgi:hypothetical protein